MPSTHKPASRFSLTCLLLILCGIGTARTTLADTLTFEGEPEGTFTTATTAANMLTFANSEILTAGSLLAESEFPPFSGLNVLGDSGGAMTITFNSGVANFSGYFTYTQGLTLQFFDASSALLGTFTTNLLCASSGNFTSNTNAPLCAPNEFVQFSTLMPGGISFVTITGAVGGNSFVMDDLSFTNAPGGPVAVPEPATLVLLLTGLPAAAAWRKRRRPASAHLE
jgi:hypothetical protein